MTDPVFAKAKARYQNTLREIRDLVADEVDYAPDGENLASYIWRLCTFALEYDYWRQLYEGERAAGFPEEEND